MVIAAAKNNNNIAVEWEVANETDITGYEVERSTDGTNFIKVKKSMKLAVNKQNNCM